jgi:hypothetical protein
MRNLLRNLPALKFAVCLLALSAAMCLGGCQDTSSPQAQTGDKVLRDPMNYKMSDDDFPSVSGGGIGDLDKQGLKRDWNNLINPNP